MSLLSAPAPEPCCPEPIDITLADASILAKTGQLDELVVSPARPLSPPEFIACRQHAETLGLVIIADGSRAVIRERTGELAALEGEAEFDLLWLELRKGLRRTLAWRDWPRLRRLLHVHPRHS